MLALLEVPDVDDRGDDRDGQGYSQTDQEFLGLQIFENLSLHDDADHAILCFPLIVAQLFANFLFICNSLIFYFSPYRKKFIFIVINLHLRHFDLTLLRI